MNTLLINLARALIEGLAKLATPLIAFFAGMSKAKGKQNEEDLKVLKKQRDNNVNSVAGANSKWVRIRKRQNK